MDHDENFELWRIILKWELPCRTMMVYFGSWRNIISYEGSWWTIMNLDWPVWTLMDHYGSRWGLRDHQGLWWIMMDPYGPCGFIKALVERQDVGSGMRPAQDGGHIMHAIGPGFTARATGSWKKSVCWYCVASAMGCWSGDSNYIDWLIYDASHCCLPRKAWRTLDNDNDELQSYTWHEKLVKVMTPNISVITLQ